MCRITFLEVFASEGDQDFDSDDDRLTPEELAELRHLELTEHPSLQSWQSRKDQSAGGPKLPDEREPIAPSIPRYNPVGSDDSERDPDAGYDNLDLDDELDDDNEDEDDSLDIDADLDDESDELGDDSEDDLLDLDDEFDESDVEQVERVPVVAPRAPVQPTNRLRFDEDASSGNPLVPIRDAIGGGEWVSLSAHYMDESRSFKVQLHDFERLATDQSHSELHADGSFWRLSLSIVNLALTQCKPYRIKMLLALIDEEGYEFRPNTDSPLEYDFTSGAGRFADTTAASPLPPKVAIRGAVIFLLPNATSEYALTARDKQVWE